MTFSVAIQYKTPSGEIKTTGTKNTSANYVSRELQKEGMIILSIKSQGVGKNIPRQKANVEEGIQASRQEGNSIIYYEAPTSTPTSTAPPPLSTTTSTISLPSRLDTAVKERLKTKIEAGEVQPSKGEELYLKYGSKGRYVPSEQTLSETEKQHAQLYETRLGIQSDQQYQLSVSGQPGVYQIVSGKDVRGKLIESEQQLSDYERAQAQLSEYKSRGYIVTETDKGYTVSIPESVALKEFESKLYKGKNQFEIDVSKGAATFLGGFAKPEYIYYSMTGQYDKADKTITKWQYGIDQSLKSGRLWEIPLQIPVVTNVLMPYGAGKVMGVGMNVARGISPLFGKGTQVVLGGTMLGLGAATTVPMIERKDWFGLTSMGIGIVSAGAGFRSVPKYGTGYSFGQKIASTPKYQALSSRISGLKPTAFEMAYKIPGVKRAVSDISTFRQTGWEMKAMTGYGKSSRMSLLDRFRYKPVEYKTPWTEQTTFREGITTAEQLSARGRDPFASRFAPAKWGGYETSWDWYAQSMGEEGYFRSYISPPKILMSVDPMTGKAITQFVVKPKIHVGAFSGKFSYPELESGKLPSMQPAESLIVKFTGKPTTLKFPSIARVTSISEPSTVTTPSVSKGGLVTSTVARGYTPKMITRSMVSSQYLNFIESGIYRGVHEYWGTSLPKPRLTLPFFMTGVKMGGLGGTGVGTISSLFSVSLPKFETKIKPITTQLFDFQSIQKVTPISIQRQGYGVLQEQITRQDIAPTQAYIQESILSPIQAQQLGVKQITIQQVKPLLVTPTIPKYTMYDETTYEPPSPKYKPPSTKPPYTIPGWVWPSQQKTGRRYTYGLGKGTGYRFRTHKVPTLEQFLKGGMF